MGKFSTLIRKLFSLVKKQTATEAKPSLLGEDCKLSPLRHENPVEPSTPEGAEEKEPVATGQQKSLADEPSEPIKEVERPANTQSPPITPVSGREQPYIIQIGFDFGTSFSKCICRDFITDRAWVHNPPNFKNYQLPFLIPSIFLFIDRKFQYVQEQDIHYTEGGLYHLKQALVKVALDQMDDAVLKPYKIACEQFNIDNLRSFIESCAVYFLAGALGTIKGAIKCRMSGFGNRPDDYMAVNLSVPVANAQQPTVWKLFHEILCEAFILADSIPGHPIIDLEELESLRKQNFKAKGPDIEAACYIYPEVSANVQGFVRSRVSRPDIYLFSDTGAATVDQSTFIYHHEPGNTEHLTYFYGNVIPCGSSWIDLLAAEIKGQVDHPTLEDFRRKKESGARDSEIIQAKNKIAQILERKTINTLARTKHKLTNRDNIYEIRVIFGGGGHCKDPYAKSVLVRPFSCNLFREPIHPDVVGLPIPPDLDFGTLEQSIQKIWMNRLSVAYGLSFFKEDLTGFTYPKDVESPNPDQIWPRGGNIPPAISNDEC